MATRATLKMQKLHKIKSLDIFHEYQIMDIFWNFFLTILKFSHKQFSQLIEKNQVRAFARLFGTYESFASLIFKMNYQCNEAFVQLNN